MAGTREDCIFCRIGAGTVPAHTLYENARIIAFLDLHPIHPGHVQIIPRTHYPAFDDLPEPLLAEIAATGQKLARVLRQLFDAPRVGFMFSGADIAHVHAHVLPLHARDDITSGRYIIESPVTYRMPDTPPAEELRRIALGIRERLLGES